jgi:DNA-directed RNA polymerase specialized sigma24 family protein
MMMDAKLILVGVTTVQDELYVVPDFDGFEELYRREYPGLYGVASALVSADKRDDMVQDTMYRALLHWNRVRQLDRPGAWCHRVLVNACRMVLAPRPRRTPVSLELSARGSHHKRANA